ncbi:hypothetical protein E2C01_102534 [Portunus trituberculatus]|uniref:Uncharacterized protein n=1 Tax=Portunus trituberculatus TaxID=210409 RepID=A0A5B7KHK2_PORTR|nr:hypothetical protein [Portunus trituberculatus]
MTTLPFPPLSHLNTIWCANDSISARPTRVSTWEAF